MLCKACDGGIIVNECLIRNKINFNTEAVFWMTNKDWFYLDEEKNVW